MKILNEVVKAKLVKMLNLLRMPNLGNHSKWCQKWSDDDSYTIPKSWKSKILKIGNLWEIRNLKHICALSDCCQESFRVRLRKAIQSPYVRKYDCVRPACGKCYGIVFVSGYVWQIVTVYPKYQIRTYFLTLKAFRTLLHCKSHLAQVLKESTFERQDETYREKAWCVRSG